MEFTTGKFQEFTATREFALNFEDRKIKSVKIRANDYVLYDGEVADYKKPNGEQVIGRCPSLKSAITSMGWLVLNENGKKKATAKVEAPAVIPQRSGDYDGFKGGSFDTFAMSEKDIHVGKVPPSAPRHGSFKDTSVIKEENLIIKNNNFGKKEALIGEENDLSVSGDQVEVKKGFTVNSSTSVNKEIKRSMPVVQRDEMGSESTQMIKNIKAPVTAGKKKNTFLVDANTPLTINENMTSEEINKMKTVPEGDSQNGRVVSKIDRSKMTVQSTDGIIMKKKASTTEGISITTEVQGTREMSIGVKVSSGGEAASVIQDEGNVVAKVPSVQQKDADAASKAQARAEARKKAAVQTQAMMEKEKKPVVASETDEMDYLSMLPADWGTMHWVRKEVFIKSLTDIGFIKYILATEAIKAIQNACNERLKELGQKSAG